MCIYNDLKKNSTPERLTRGNTISIELKPYKKSVVRDNYDMKSFPRRLNSRL